MPNDPPATRSVGSTVTPEQFAALIDVPFVANLAEQTPSAAFVERIPISFARRFNVLGFEGTQGRTSVAISDPTNWGQIEVVARFLRTDVDPFLAGRDAIQVAINEAYQQRSGQAQEFIESLDRDDVLAELQALHDREDLLDSDGRSPVIKLVNLMLFEAVKAEASDVHVQPYEERVVIRFRIDGVLFDSFEVGKDLQDEIISRIKVLGGMNIAEKRLPQDGRATVGVGDRTVDLRIASLPASHGERVVIRLLDKGARLYTLTEIGMDERTLGRFGELIHLEHGLILVTGPTGSGKTTTLYAALQEINTTDQNVITLEDPIEYEMPGISQSQINETKGMTFARGLRNVLRQDPDIIMVGEIRDHETAVMAIQSALTGHLVFSTLHTNDAASAVTRMLDLGIEPYLVSSSLLAVLAQRLVRCICTHCRQPHPLGDDDLTRLFGQADGIEDAETTAYVGPGCELCRQTGYRGRKGIFELLIVDDAVRAGIQQRTSAAQLRSSACAAGMTLLRDDGIAKIHSGMTAVDEVIRVTMRSSL